ncbi:hypothetical protein NEOLEDRAFT_1183607 [Neolentinus lepideus HHB14362 ss-1]|uniref:Uncharacterized protein n=1 Tax=Neolentinus lepideus HHB14362 ss-1 TaxID=1314782 RepID=A0A165N4B5_9AGAM|nr:hypothetical protein NEOLEDRAFT_1183607 [Neolentinus lepideus HHB14362 ss-1]
MRCANDSYIRILDTPGLADTRGLDKDNEHRAAIAEFIQKNTGAPCDSERYPDSAGHYHRLCIDYNSLALSGSFVGYIVSAIRLLELRLQAMKDGGVSLEAEDRMANKIAILVQKLKVVEEDEKKRSGFQKLKDKVWSSTK